MFPLFPLLNKVIQKLCATQKGDVILIAPWWSSLPWFLHVCGPHSVWKVVPSVRMEALSCSIIKQQDFEKRSLVH